MHRRELRRIRSLPLPPKRLVEELGLAAGDELAIVAASRDQVAVEKVDRHAQFLREMERFRWRAPKAYRFDCDEANER